MPATSSDTNPNAVATEPGYAYDADFFRYIHEGAIRSAHRIVPLVLQSLGISSVLDVGCGAGAWLSVYSRYRVPDLLGVDGAYVRGESLLIPPEFFRSHDITRPFDLQRQFDLVQCLEVGEHIPKSASATLVKTLVRHSKLVLFSAATPGQGGENHVNEQSYEFWRKLFNSHGYKPFDCVRPSIKGFSDVEIWYRHNVMLYASPEIIPVLPGSVASTHVSDGQRIANVSGWLYRVRTKAFSFLPVSWLTLIALAKHRIVLAYRVVTRQRIT